MLLPVCSCAAPRAIIFQRLCCVPLRLPTTLREPGPGIDVQDPFYTKEKRVKKSGMLAADAWLDSSLYESGQSFARGWTKFQDFMNVFRVRGFMRLFVELLSDGFTFGAIGAVLMTALALPAFDATATGEFNKAEDYSVVFQDRYGN